MWACLLSGLLLRQGSSRRVWLSLLPIVGGVALASAQELSFVWAAFLASAASDVALAPRDTLPRRRPPGTSATRPSPARQALRNVLSKKSMDGPQVGEGRGGKAAR